ncbi:MAG: Gfo/Idh/MocA family oxidoreductase [Fibrobacteria bacterium]|nr:Gfo/Idh/MocA family oxidoreductase [Fibrobacteria bacterium]
MADKIRILVAGCGNMGKSHASSYHRMDEFELLAFVSRDDGSREKLPDELKEYKHFDEFHSALAELKPDAVSICTWPDTHAEYVEAALKAGCHVFVEKPIATTVEEAEKLAKLAKEADKKVVIGYILRHHPSWAKFVEIGKTLGKPLVMRMNLNQQSSGALWETHKALMNSISPIVDCGVHYVDIMCLVTGAKPVQVQAIGANLSDEIREGMYNYGNLQVRFDDGSVGWYEAGWGPMMSEIAFFVKDIVGPKGCVSIADHAAGDSNDIDSHTKTNTLLRHHAALDKDGNPVKEDEVIDMKDEPGHQDLCDREQAYFLKAIQENLDLTDHVQDAVNSLKIVLAADQSIKEGKAINL